MGRRRRRVFEFFTINNAPEFSFGLEAAISSDFDSNISNVFKRKDEIFSKRLVDHQCLVYRPDGQVVSTYFWVSDRGKVPLTPWLNLIVPEGFRYIWDCKTEELARGRGYYTHGLKQIAHGSPCLIAVEGNEAARKAIENAGFIFSHVVDTKNLGLFNIVNGKIKLSTFNPLQL